MLSHLGSLIRRTRERSWVVAALSNRRLEVLRPLAEGLTTRQIASRLGIAARVLYRKLGVRTPNGSRRTAIALGLEELHEPAGS